jgi:2'-5' RNA ligase
MSELIALDVAILPPPDVSEKAVAISVALPAEDFQGLRLDASHLPHVTLMQLFARGDQLEPLLGQVEAIARSTAPMPLRVTGAAKHGDTVSIAIENTPPLAALHEQLMDALREFEHLQGGADAFVDRDARLRDVLWVAGYRAKSSLLSFRPHITLGHASQAPVIDPFTFEAVTVAVCHLGRFCTCRHVFRQGTLSSVSPAGARGTQNGASFS